MARGKRLSVAVVVAVVLLAGCNGFGSDPTDTGNGDGEATVAPGVSEGSGLANASALLAAHRESMNESGFTYRFDYRRTQRLQFADGTNQESVASAVTGRVAAEAGLTPFLRNETDRSTNVTTTTLLYVANDVAAERTVAGGNVSVEESFEDVSVLDTTHYQMGDFLARGDWTVSERREDAVVLQAGPTWSDWDVEHAGERNISSRRYFEGELVVSADGRIRQMTVNQTDVERVQIDGDLHSRSRSVRRLEYELLATTETAVERPGWVDDAVNETATAAALDARASG